MKIRFIYITFTISICVKYVYSDDSWIDPHSMDIQPIHTKRDIPYSSQSSSSESKVMSHFKRTINLMLASVVLDNSDPTHYTGHLYVSIENYKFLKKFTSAVDGDALELQKVDEILSNIFSKSYTEKIYEFVLSWQDYIHYLLSGKVTIIFLSILFILFSSYKFVQASFTLKTIISSLVFLIWVIDFGFTWILMLQEHEINQIADSHLYKDLPSHCDPSKLTYWQYFKSIFSKNEDCRNYYKNLMADTKWNVGPLTVLSHQAGIIFVTPVEYISKSIWDKIPFPLNIAVLIIAFLFLGWLICIVLSFVTNTSFSINLLHILKINFDNSKKSADGDVISGKNLAELLSIAKDRPKIELIKDKKSKKKPIENNRKAIYNKSDTNAKNYSNTNKIKQENNDISPESCKTTVHNTQRKTLMTRKDNENTCSSNNDSSNLSNDINSSHLSA